MEIPQYDIKGNNQPAVDVSDDTFGVALNKKLLAQYVQIHHENVSIGTRKTKDRGEVSGGGKKPWRQKGTGRARAGSSRSPVWVGGGHIHAIVPHLDTHVRMPKKMRVKALSVALSWHAKQGSLFAVTQFTMEKPKTKDVVAFLASRDLTGKSVLFITNEMDKSFVKSVSNIQKVDVIAASQLNAYSVLSHSVVVCIGDSYKTL
ncbi:50S ribosomal protein L4 [candidate division WWE3 bacterium CG_4_10_14_0_2_um_filter_41_14]|uniref:Large ribosomal subunit protein uL4 n=1 Tax=candidate division WWE3 bacterium CG_4_10_14_0_2_um_filter_41_14 TaxID=1975072 RepID=A0A2M7TF31_UNCKA|nr:MAG: 50S ribosomal protein L4 [candidate division WWE3 bacterium CG_4_10_14_0_2_um_filter_41_14]